MAEAWEIALDLAEAELLDDVVDLADISRPAWQRWAACRGRTTDLFFDPERADEALAICRGCPVRDQCRDFSRREAFGVWGGRAPAERRRASASGGAGRAKAS